MTEFKKPFWRLASALHAALASQTSRGRPLTLPQHNWQHCEHLLRQIERAEGRGWHLATAQLRTDLRSYIEALQCECSSLATFLRNGQPAHQMSTVGSVYQDLLSLEEEFEELDFDLAGRTISVTTESVTLEDIYLGAFEIRFNWGRIQSDSPYRVIAKDPQPAAGRSEVTHPHVNSERLCEGESHVAIRQAIQQGRLLDFFTLVASGLRSYNSDSPFVDLEVWFGGACVDCGRVVDGDDRFVCQGCEQCVCGGCESSCCHCGDTYCSQCSFACTGCDDNYCSNCLRMCRECLNHFCSSCLQEDERCNNCHEKENESASNATADPIEVQSSGLGQALVSA